MSQIGYRGISFPFRISGTGGIEMSGTDIINVPHLEEAIKQILLTRPRERCMEYHFKSDLDLDIFEPNDISAQKLVEHQIRQALSALEDRIEVINVDVTSKNNEILADISFKVLKYNTTYSKIIKVGDVNETDSGET